HPQIVTGAAADLEDSRLGRQPHLTADQVGEDLSPCDIPPVDIAQFVHAVVDMAFHQANTHSRLSVNVTSGVTNSIGRIGQAGLSASGSVASQTQKALSPRLTSETMRKRVPVRARLSRRPWSRKLHLL